MNRLYLAIALKHLLARKRQSVVSLMGIVLGVAFFLAIASLMRGSERDFIKRLIDNSPHITIQDEYRNPQVQPAEQIYPQGAVEIRSVKPETETRGLRGYEQIMDRLRNIPHLRASPVLAGEALISFAGKDEGVTLNGMIPAQIADVTTIVNYITKGSVEELIANPDGIVIGDELAKRLSLAMNDNITLSTGGGQTHTFKIVAMFHTGRSNYDVGEAFANLKRVQALLNRPNRANNIIIKLDDPYQARDIAAQIENTIGYKSVSWQEASADLMNALLVRNTIMYTVVSAVLVVAAFGIYNVISTVVHEKQRDIAILKSVGFQARDILHIFVLQGFLLGAVGSVVGLSFGALIMQGMSQVTIKPPGVTEVVHLPIAWGVAQFALAAGFAMTAALFAAFLPARKGAHVHPVEILRGGT